MRRLLRSAVSRTMSSPSSSWHSLLSGDARLCHQGAIVGRRVRLTAARNALTINGINQRKIQLKSDSNAAWLMCGRGDKPLLYGPDRPSRRLPGLGCHKDKADGPERCRTPSGGIRTATASGRCVGSQRVIALPFDRHHSRNRPGSAIDNLITLGGCAGTSSRPVGTFQGFRSGSGRSQQDRWKLGRDQAERASG